MFNFAVGKMGTLGGGSSLAKRAIAILRRPGITASVYTAGAAGVSVNGLLTGNYSDAGTTFAVVDGTVQQVNDGVGSNTASQSTAGNRPTERRGAWNLIRNSAMAGASVGNFPTGWIVAPASGLTWSVTGTGAENGFNYVDVRLSGTAVGTSSSTVLAGAVNHIAGAIGQVFTNSEYIRRQAGSLTNVSATVLIVGQSNDGVGIGSAPGVNTYTVPSTGDLSACRASISAALTASAVNVVPYFQANTVAGAVDVTFRMAAPQCEIGSTASDYSPTTSAAASNPTAGRYSWEFDGVNDSFALGSVPFQMSDDHAVIVGCTVSTTSAAVLFSENGGLNPRLQLYTLGGNLICDWADDAAVSGFSSKGAVASVGTALVGSMRKVVNAKVVRANGSAAAVNNTALGATTLTNARIGCNSVNAVDANFNSGNISIVIVVKGTLSDADMLLLERFAASTLLNGPQF